MGQLNAVACGGDHGVEKLNPYSLQVIRTSVESPFANALPHQKFQCERHGYFVADGVDHVQGTKQVLKLAVEFQDS